MYDDDFLKWINEMPIGYMQYLWRQYKMSYSDDSEFPTIGDNFKLIPMADITQIIQPEDTIDQFERLLNEEKITLQDLIRREE